MKPNRSKIYLCVLIAICSNIYIGEILSQCDAFVSINPKSPIRVCLKNGHENIQLNGAFSQKPCGFEWSPDDKINDTKILNPVVTISEPGMYTFKLSGAFPGTGPNIAVNGEFNGGNSGFGSDMNYTTGPSCPPGNYTVTNTNPANYNSAWSDCRNGGNFYLADSPSDPNVRIWYQSLNVNPNTWYTFEFSFASVFYANPPILVGAVNGEDLGPPTYAPGTPCVWVSACYAWFSGSNTTAEFQIYDRQSVQWGDDFVLDNIRIRPACTGMATVKIIAEKQPEIHRDTVKCKGSNLYVAGTNISEPGTYDLVLPKGPNATCDTLLNLTVDDFELFLDSVTIDTITCYKPNGSIKLERLYGYYGNLLDTIGFTFIWSTTNGQIVSGATSSKVIVNKKGTYSVQITYRKGRLTCIRNFAFIMSENTQLPSMNAGPDKIINCDSLRITLNGSAPPNHNLIWTTKNGRIVSGANSTNPIVDKGGTYIFEVTNPQNGCKGLDTAIVLSYTNKPIAFAGNDTLITCQNTSLTLMGQVNPASANYLMTWKNGSGIILNQQNQTFITVDTTDSYIFQVVDTLSKCQYSDTVKVGGSKVKPIANAGLDKTIDCITTNINLDGSGSSQGVSFKYLWKGLQGQQVTNPNGLFPIVTKKGFYEIEVTNSDNNCIEKDTVEVLLNAVLPTISISMPPPLNCKDKQVEIDASLTQGQDYSFKWSTVNGQIVGTDTLNKVTVSKSAFYQFTVLNKDNGCQNDTLVEVLVNTQKPTIVIIPPLIINCTQPFVDLDATGSSVGVNFTYSWKTTDGNIAQNGNTTKPTVDAAGTYWFYVLNTTNFCIDSQSVVVNQVADLPKALIDPIGVFGCDKTQFSLNGNKSSSGAAISFEWKTTNGNLTGGTNTLQPTADKGGDYFLILTNTVSNCKDTAKVTVIENKTKPNVQATTPAIITCKQPTISLDASKSDNGTNFSGSWYFGGQKISDNSSEAVGKPGIYTYILKNTTNQCIDSFQVTVNENKILPTSNAGTDKDLVCVPDFVILDGSSSSQGNNFTYSWTGPTGAVITTPNSDSTSVKQNGIYTLTVKDTLNGCEQTDQVEVFLKVSLPIVSIQKNKILNCSNPTLILDANGSSTGANYKNQWSTLNGNIVSGSQTLAPTINQAGLYQLVIMDNTTSCQSKDSVLISSDFKQPLADAGKPDTITCKNSVLTLSGKGSDQGQFINYQWFTNNGNILSGNATTEPTIDKAGTYTLIVNNSENGCKDTSMVIIALNIAKPNAVIAIADTLSCKKSTVQLNASTSTLVQPNDLIQWSNNQGNTINNANTLAPSISQTGTYTLIISNLRNDCSDTATIFVPENFQKPTVSIQSQTVLNCKDTSLILAGNITPSGFTFTWKKDNQVQSFNTISSTISKSGTFEIIGTLNTSGCKDSASVTITEDKMLPTALAGKDTSFECKTTQIRLDATSSNGMTISWKEVSGATIKDANTLNPVIYSPGTYILTALNPANYCSKSDTLLVVNNKKLPTLKIVSVDTLTCIRKEAIINATGSSQGANFTIDWSKIGGTVFGTNLNSLQPKVIQGGTYQLLITDLITGCKDSIQAIVQTDTSYQGIQINKTPYITCKNRIIDLISSGITNPNYSYLWTTVDGKFTTPTNLSSVKVNAGGVYTVVATNNKNGCQSNDSKIVLTDTVPPSILIAKPAILTCTTTQAVLDASSSKPNNSSTYLWTTSNGNIVSGNSSSKATINKSGIYLLTMTSDSNGCSSKSSVEVVEDKIVPIANAGADSEINCRLKYAILDGSSSSKGSEIVSQWTSLNGTVKADADKLVAKAGTVGVYKLTITNLRNGCTAFDEAQVTENAPTDAEIKSNTPPCDRVIGSLSILSATGGKPPYYYSLKDWKTYGLIPATENLPVGKYTVRIKDANECELKKIVEIKEPVKPSITMTPYDTAIYEKDSILLKVNVNSKYPLADVIWSSKDTTYQLIDSLTARIFPLVATYYKVIVTDSLGCKDSVLNLVQIRPIREVYIPNAFSPNGDGANDFFTVYANDRTALKITKFEVFNRWGEMVFSNYNFLPNDPAQGWDGHFRNQLLNPNVFVYWAEIEFIDGSKKVFKGDVTLMGQ